MEFHQLRYFLAIADQSSISRASEELHISQSALSVALKSLERELGFPLFERNGRRLVINDYGRYFAAQVRTALKTLDDARGTIAQDVLRRQHTINCATNLTMGPISRILILEYRKRRPDAVLRLGHKGSVTFKESAPDIEIFGTPKEQKTNGTLVKVLRERFVAVFPAGYLKADGQPITLGEMDEVPYIITGPGHMQTIVNEMFRETGFTPNVVCELQVYSDVLDMVRVGAGFTIAPERTWLADYRDLDVREIADSHRERNIYASIANNATPSLAAVDFLEFLRTDGQKALNDAWDEAKAESD